MVQNIFNFNIPDVDRFINSKFKGAFCLSGLNSPLKLILLNYILNGNKKVLLITPDEQAALKYQKDYESLFNKKDFVKILPYQEISPYSVLDKNFYIYKEQYEILSKKPSFVIAPIKAVLEKFPENKFYLENKIILEKDKDFDYSKLIQTLVDFGYKRTSMALDIGEFAARGDIVDIYTFYNHPLRIEFFGDTIEDIRFFNPNTQKSFSKTEVIEIPPLYKFISNKKTNETFKKELIQTIEPFKDNETIQTLLNETTEKIDTMPYFEGVEYYLNFINKNLVSILDYFKDYILIFDESALINSKIVNLDREYNEDYKNNLENSLSLPIQGKNHIVSSDLKKEIKKFKKIGFDNFIEDDFFEDEETFSDKVFDFNSSIPPSFSSNGEKFV